MRPSWNAAAQAETSSQQGPLAWSPYQEGKKGPWPSRRVGKPLEQAGFFLLGGGPMGPLVPLNISHLELLRTGERAGIGPINLGSHWLPQGAFGPKRRPFKAGLSLAGITYCQTVLKPHVVTCAGPGEYGRGSPPDPRPLGPGPGLPGTSADLAERQRPLSCSCSMKTKFGRAYGPLEEPGVRPGKLGQKGGPARNPCEGLWLTRAGMREISLGMDRFPAGRRASPAKSGPMP